LIDACQDRKEAGLAYHGQAYNGCFHLFESRTTLKTAVRSFCITHNAENRCAFLLYRAQRNEVQGPIIACAHVALCAPEFAPARRGVRVSYYRLRSPRPALPFRRPYKCRLISIATP
jgi:hypothetical protein